MPHPPHPPMYPGHHLLFAVGPLTEDLVNPCDVTSGILERYMPYPQEKGAGVNGTAANPRYG